MRDWRWFYRVRLRLRTLFRRNQVERELDEEFRYHLDQRIEQEIARGLSPEESRRVAVRAMEGIEQKKEECRDMRHVNFIETLLQDFRYAFRGLGKSPGFSAVAVLTLTLGIGASMAILTVVNSVLLRSLPFRDADRLVVLFATSPARGVYRDSTSFPDFLDWKGQSQAFTAVAAWRPDPFNVTGGGAPEPIVGLRASHEIFGVLGVSPALGRGFDKEEQERKSPVAVIGHGLWMRRFGGVPDILGKSIVLNDVSHSQWPGSSGRTETQPASGSGSTMTRIRNTGCPLLASRATCVTAVGTSSLSPTCSCPTSRTPTAPLRTLSNRMFRW
ncbi:MAG: hypothetical protein DMG08_14535 [Acidobacteria bacterium]|nr:MAG: hypothetical protein DMG08_14535 [Acidobacteriota bacterium]